VGAAAAAASELTAAADLHQSLDDAHSASRVLVDLAQVLLASDDPAGARRALDRATALRARTPDPVEEPA